jgi:hypothetical protein
MEEAVPGVLPDLVLDPAGDRALEGEEAEAVRSQAPAEPVAGVRERRPDRPFAAVAVAEALVEKRWPAAGSLRGSLDEERRRVAGAVVGPLPALAETDPARERVIGISDLVRDAPGFLFARPAGTAALIAGEIQDCRLEEEREVLSEHERHEQRVPAEDGLVQMQGLLTIVPLAGAGGDDRAVLADLLRPLDAGELAELRQRIRPFLWHANLELLDPDEPLARKQDDGCVLHPSEIGPPAPSRRLFVRLTKCVYAAGRG